MTSNGSAVEHAWAETVERYITWGKAQGRSDGAPWVKEHTENVIGGLEAWRKAGDLQTIEDITPELYDQHSAIWRAKYANKTLRHRQAFLKSFVHWCVLRELLPKSPLLNCRKAPNKAKKVSRAFTMPEFVKLLDAVEKKFPARRELYLAAVFTGFRASELRSLAKPDFDCPKRLLHLKAEHEKNRIERWFPLADGLCRMFRESLHSTRENLLRLTSQPVQEFNADLKLAGIPKKTDDGVLDFHSLRRTGVSWLGMLGAPNNVRHAFGRHSDTSTNHRYDLASQDQLRGWISKMEQALEDCGPGGNGVESENSDGGENVQARGLMSGSIPITLILETVLAWEHMTQRQRDTYRLLPKRVLRKIYGGKKNHDRRKPLRS